LISCLSESNFYEFHVQNSHSIVPQVNNWEVKIAWSSWLMTETHTPSHNSCWHVMLQHTFSGHPTLDRLRPPQIFLPNHALLCTFQMFKITITA
jgi:hypothetical protein